MGVGDIRPEAVSTVKAGSFEHGASNIILTSKEGVRNYTRLTLFPAVATTLEWL
jgi:hypothetical protein